MASRIEAIIMAVLGLIFLGGFIVDYVFAERIATYWVRRYRAGDSIAIRLARYLQAKYPSRPRPKL